MGCSARRRDQKGANCRRSRYRETYYHHWLNALERIVAAKGLADPEMLARTRNAWANACARTPHGTPIELQAGDFFD
jgi:hypothetical protein